MRQFFDRIFGQLFAHHLEAIRHPSTAFEAFPAEFCETGQFQTSHFRAF
jgi:hypothetical protein